MFDKIKTKAENSEQPVEQETYYSALMDHASDAIFLADSQGNLIKANRKAEELLGYSHEELICLDISRIHPPEVLEVTYNYFIDVLLHKQTPVLETLVLRKDGSQIPVDITASCIELKGKPIVQSIVRDIRDRKTAEQENKLLKERIQFILKSSPAVIYTRKPDDNYGITFVSNNIMGYTPADFVNDSGFWISKVHPEDVTKVFTELPQNYLIYEYRFLKKNGEYAWMYDELKLVRDTEGVPVEIVGYFADITERKTAEEKLQQTNEELARATRLKDEFLANMSHELRTPLNAILGLTEALQERIFGVVNTQQIKALRTVENSASHLLSLINDILDVAKIESGQIELECISIPLMPLCSSSMAFIKQQALKKRIQLETKLPPNLPNLLIDERRIRQVLINLLTNAVKFTPEEGKITLAVSCLPESEDIAQQNYLRISVIDTGIGIAPENINKLFQPFVQIDSALNRKYTGTGLGLALVKQIVELHGGRVEITSELGIGSCFTIDLPCEATF